jgi:gluconate 2-dehydrogenase gamma chain
MSAIKVNLMRRRLLIGGAVASVGAAAVGAIRDGELGAPPQSFRGAVPWAERTADAPPGASGSGYVFFSPAEAAFIEAAVGRLIPHDEVGPGGVEASVPFFLDRQLAGKFGQGDHYFLGSGLSKPIQPCADLPRGNLRRSTSMCVRISGAVYSLT